MNITRQDDLCAVLTGDYLQRFALPRLCRGDADPRELFISEDPAGSPVTFPYLDLLVYLVVPARRRIILITEDILLNSGLTAQELFEAAVRNSHDRALIRPMSELVSSVFLPDEPPYIFTLRAGLYGAASGLMHADLLLSTARRLGTRCLLLLPSSVHEIIVLPGRPEDKERFDALVASVNREEVSEEEQLADHCYLFDADTGEITF